MIRTATLKLADVMGRATLWLHGFGSTFDIYPTRSGEAFVSWFILAWSLSLLMPGDMMVGPQYAWMLRIGSEQSWGYVGAAFSIMRIVALIGNGHWRPSPMLRFVGAFYSFLFWTTLSICYYLSVRDGAPDFPMRRALYVPIAFEFYAALWIGHDMHIQKLKFMARGASATGLTVRAGNG